MTVASIVWGFVGLAVLAVIWAAFGAFNAQGRLRAKEEELELTEEELEEWSGVLDVRREIRDSVNDPDVRQRLYDKYNKDETDT